MLIPTLLAYAEQSDTSGIPAMQLILIGIVSLVVAAALAAAPMAVAMRRGSRFRDPVRAAAVLWALAAAAVAIRATMLQMSYRQEYQTDLMSGYMDPQNPLQPPALPIAFIVGLAVVYLLLFVAASMSENRATEINGHARE